MGEMEEAFRKIAELEAYLHNELVNQIITIRAGNRTSSGRVLWVSPGEIEMVTKDGKIITIPLGSIEKIIHNTNH